MKNSATYRTLLAGALLALLVASPIRATNVTYHGGPIMTRVRAVLIFWLPPGSHYVAAPLDNAAQDRVYERAIRKFFTSLSGTSYLNITTQYIGPCHANSCDAPANRGGVALGPVLTDLNPYPRSPLWDTDVRKEIANLISQKGLSFDLRTEFFVFTAAGVQECRGFFGVKNICTGTEFCAYHNEFDYGHGKVVYAYMPADDSLGGCQTRMNVSPPPHQLAADEEILTASHELFESITDPEPLLSLTELNISNPEGDTAWWDSNNLLSSTYAHEIGDKCDHKPARLELNGHTFVVQQQWSNDSSSCVASLGRSVRFDIKTGSDNLRGDSSATATLVAPGAKTRNPAGCGDIRKRLAQAEKLHRLAIQTLNQLVEAGRPSREIRLARQEVRKLASEVAKMRHDLKQCLAHATPTPVTAETITLKRQGQGSWGESSMHAVVAGLRPQTLASTDSPLATVTLNLASHNSLTESNDKWNVENLKVKIKDSTGKVECAFTQGADPLASLTGSLPFHVFAMSCPAGARPAPGTKFDRITFVMETGGDDLRGDSSVTASLNASSGGSFRTVTLKARDQSGWPNNSTHRISFALSRPKPLSEFGSVAVTLTSHDSLFETPDNWNIEGVNISLSNSHNGKSECFAKEGGNPFKRLTGDDPTVTIKARHGC